MINMTQAEYAKIIAKNLKRIAYENNKTQADISKDLDLNKQTVSSWFRGERIPRMSKIDLLCGYFNCKRSDIMEEMDPKKKNIIRVYQHSDFQQTGAEKMTSVADIFAGDESLRISKRIPVLGRVAAGIPISANEDVTDYLEISGEMALNGEYFGLIIDGDSMEPRMHRGDIAIVRKQEDADDGDTVIALVNGNDATCKKLRKNKDSIALVSLNPIYEPMYFSMAEIDETPVRIIGKVVEFRGKP